MDNKQKKVDAALRGAGFGGLEDPNLIHQLAFMVRGHDHFRQLLSVCEPRKRNLMYDTMKPYLRFEAWPLHQYEIRSAELAAAQNLPIIKPDGEIADPLTTIAEKALAHVDKWGNAKGNLELVCAKCTKAEYFPAQTRYEAYRSAEKADWYLEDEKAWCPECRPAKLDPEAVFVPVRMGNA